MIKDDVLRELEENKGQYISGSEMASRLGVSRNAIWKTIKTLEKKGYIIDSVPRLGYALSDKSDILSSFSIEKHTKYPLNIEVYDTIPSTNTELKALAEDGALEGLVLVANEQTLGRGRMGKKFYSPKNTGVYLSILLRPEIPADKALYLTTMAAVATAKAIEDVSSKKAGIKWVNDIYIDDKKVCGILTESNLNIETNTLDYVIVGIGINICPPEGSFPSDIKDIATSVFENSKDAHNLKSKLVGHLLDYFFDFYTDSKTNKYVDEYISRSMLIGRDITVFQNNQSLNAKALAIDKNCRLQVEYEDGKTKWLNCGEVSIRV